MGKSSEPQREMPPTVSCSQLEASGLGFLLRFRASRALANLQSTRRYRRMRSWESVWNPVAPMLAFVAVVFTLNECAGNHFVPWVSELKEPSLKRLIFSSFLHSFFPLIGRTRRAPSCARCESDTCRESESTSLSSIR